MIVVTTPTGSIGSQVLQHLLTTDGTPVRVIVRDPARLAPDVRDRVEVVTGSHGDPAVAGTAFAGADAVFWLPPGDPSAASLDDAYAGFTRPAAAAFRTHRVGRVVGVSALGRGTPMAGHAGHVTASLAMDDVIAASGVAYRALTMPSFMDNVVRQAEAIAGGTYFSPLDEDLKLPSCATADIAAVAARLLLDTSWTGTGEVPVLGPEDLSGADLVRIMSEVLGHEVRYQQTLPEAMRDQMLGTGASPAMAQGMADMMSAKNAGLDLGVTRTPETSTPTSFREWCTRVLRPALAAPRHAGG